MHLHLRNFFMAYTDAGQGQPILFIHGFPLTRKLWQPQVEGLANTMRILAPDLRGHGDSQAIPGPYSMDLLADDLNAFLDELEINRPVIVCGLSMGGYVAFAFFRKYKARMAGLILTATRASPDTAEAKAGRDQSTNLIKEMGAPAIVERMLPKLLSPKAYENNPAVVTRARSIMENVSPEGLLGDLAGLRDRPDSTPTLGTIRIPTLILAGGEDQIIPLEEVRAMQAGIHGARLVVIPEAGHLPNLENPERFNWAIREFVKEII